MILDTNVIMMRTTFFLALATAWCADALLMFALAEARWGSIMNRLFGALLLGLGILALTIAFGPQLWRAARRLWGQGSTRLNAWLAQLHSAYANRRRAVTASRMLTPTS